MRIMFTERLKAQIGATTSFAACCVLLTGCFGDPDPSEDMDVTDGVPVMTVPEDNSPTTLYEGQTSLPPAEEPEYSDFRIGSVGVFEYSDLKHGIGFEEWDSVNKTWGVHLGNGTLGSGWEITISNEERTLESKPSRGVSVFSFEDVNDWESYNKFVITTPSGDEIEGTIEPVYLTR